MGRFQPGNPGGPGRPKKIVEDAQRSVLLELFDEAAERAIVVNMIRKAKSRTDPVAVTAATWLWDRKYGKVKDQVEVSGDIVVKGYVSVTPDQWDDAADPPDSAV